MTLAWRLVGALAVVVAAGHVTAAQKKNPYLNYTEEKFVENMQAAGRNYELLCGDVSREMQEVAQRRLAGMGAGNVRFKVLDVYAIDEPDASFDCACAFRLFQHLTSEERARAQEQARKDELARMLGGAATTRARAHAAELLEAAGATRKGPRAVAS